MQFGADTTHDKRLTKEMDPDAGQHAFALLGSCLNDKERSDIVNVVPEAYGRMCSMGWIRE